MLEEKNTEHESKPNILVTKEITTPVTGGVTGMQNGVSYEYFPEGASRDGAREAPLSEQLPSGKAFSLAANKNM